jgi:hypothetical protein
MKKKSVQFAIAFLIITSVALPSGSLLGFPVKHLSFVLAAFTVGYHWVREGARIPTALVITLVWAFVFVAFFVIHGATNEITHPGDAIQEGIGVFTTIAIAVIALSASSQKWVSTEDIIAYGVIGALIFSMIKNSVAILMATGAISFYDGLNFYIHNFNAKFVSSEIFGGLVRVNFIIYDFFVLLALSVCLLFPDLTRKLPRSIRLIFIASALACILFAFSRYLFFVAGVVLAYSFAFRFTAIPRLAFIAICLPLIATQAEWISGAFEQRFVDQQNIESDEKRQDQTSALLEYWSLAPVIGHGLGSYAPTHVRDPRVPYSYEVQWAGFLLKTGIAGVSLMLCLAIAVIFHIVHKNKPADYLPLLALFIFFLLGGLTNQYLVTSGSGVYYLTIFCAASKLKSFNEKHA